jgi:hypothetical protein
LVTDFHSFLVRWRNHFSQLINVHGVNDVRQREMYNAGPLGLEPSGFEFEMAAEKLNKKQITRY